VTAEVEPVKATLDRPPAESPRARPRARNLLPNQHSDRSPPSGGVVRSGGGTTGGVRLERGQVEVVVVGLPVYAGDESSQEVSSPPMPRALELPPDGKPRPDGLSGETSR